MRSWTMGACHSPRWRQPLALVAANCGPLCTCKHLQLRKLCARWVPKDLTQQRRLRRVEDCTALLNMHDADSEAFFHHLVTGNQSWLHEPETKEQSKQWMDASSAPPVKFLTTLSTSKGMATVLW